MIEVKKIEYSDFDDFLNSVDLIGPSREWRNFLSSHFGFNDHFLGVHKDGILNCILPAYKVGDGLEGAPKIYSEPLYLNSAGKEIALEEILNHLSSSMRFSWFKFDFCFIVSGIAPGNGQLKKRGLSHILRIGNQGQEEILSELVDKKTRNQIKAAYQRGGFELVVGDDVDAFYEIYLRSIERLNSIPKSKEFFEKLSNAFGGNFRMIGAYKNGTLAGANLILLKNKYLHLPFNVSDLEYFKDYVNDYLYWETIKFGLERGVKVFDFGPSTLSDKSHHHFKEGFGAVAVPIYRLKVYNSLRRRLSDYFSTKKRNLSLRIKKYV